MEYEITEIKVIFLSFLGVFLIWCTETIITNPWPVSLNSQLKLLLQTSVEEFVKLFEPSNSHRMPLFRMALTFDDEKMEIYPTPQDLEASVFEILNSITRSLQVRLSTHSDHLKSRDHFVVKKKCIFNPVFMSMTLICREYRQSSHGHTPHLPSWMPRWPITYLPGPTVLWRPMCPRILRSLTDISRTMVMLHNSTVSYHPTVFLYFHWLAFILQSIGTTGWSMERHRLA